MNWQKRNCPIKMTINPKYNSCVTVTFDIQGDHHEYDLNRRAPDGVTCLKSDNQFWLLPHYLYRMYFHGPRKSFDQGKWPDVEFKTFVPPERHVNRIDFKWNDSRRTFALGIEFPFEVQMDSNIKIDILEYLYGGKEGELKEIVGRFSYEVAFCDICYAVGKGITDAIKAYGFTGLYESYVGVVPVHMVCFLKACGMGRPDFLLAVEDFVKEPEDDDDYHDYKVTSFADEMELLMFDM